MIVPRIVFYVSINLRAIRFFVACIIYSLTTASVNAAMNGVVHGNDGMVVSHSMIASEVGDAIMQTGGNAIDAAVATAFALAVTHPSAGNLGGGGFLVIHLSNGMVVTNDHREKAPAAAKKDMYLDKQGNVVENLSIQSHLASGVPGSIAGLLDVLARYGTMKRADVIAPAIELAEKGFRLDHDLAQSFGNYLAVFKK
jgi:gamma-glutamyltranspeptidase/glutathione hydrolase